MQGRHVVSHPKVVSVNIESLIPKNHRLRKIYKILDLSYIYEQTEKFYSDNLGRPSVDPVLYFKMQVLKYDLPLIKQTRGYAARIT